MSSGAAAGSANAATGYDFDWMRNEPAFMGAEIRVFLAMVAIIVCWDRLLLSKWAYTKLAECLGSPVLDAYSLDETDTDGGSAQDEKPKPVKGVENLNPRGRVKTYLCLAGSTVSQVAMLGAVSVTAWICSSQCADLTTKLEDNYSLVPGTVLVLMMDQYAFLLLSLALWFVSMIVTVEMAMMFQVTQRQLFYRRRYNEKKSSDIRQGTSLQDAESLQFDTLRDYFIRTVHNRIPAVRKNFDFSRYLSLCLDSNLVYACRFNVWSWIISVFVQALILGFATWLVKTSWPESIRQLTIAITIPLVSGVPIIWAERKIEMAVKTGLDMSRSSQHMPDEDPQHYEIKNDEGEWFSAKSIIIFVQAMSFVSTYLMVRVVAAKRLYDGSWGGTKPIEAKEAWPMAIFHVIFWMAQSYIQAKAVISLTTAMSLPPYFDARETQITECVGQLETHPFYTQGEGRMMPSFSSSDVAVEIEMCAVPTMGGLKANDGGFDMKLYELSSPPPAAAVRDAQGSKSGSKKAGIAII